MELYAPPCKYLELCAPLCTAKEGIVLFQSGLKAVIVLDSENHFFCSVFCMYSRAVFEKK